MSNSFKGDLTTLNPNKDKGVIIQQVNCQGVMGAGLAKSLYTRWPKIRSEYYKYCQGKTPNQLLGHMQAIKLGREFYCVNSFTQKNYGRYGHFTSEKLLINNIVKVCQHGQMHNWQVYVPEKIGAGLAGGNWSEIKQGIEGLNNLNIVKYVPSMKIKQKRSGQGREHQLGSGLEMQL